jgi:hypothetical protein
MNKPILLVDFDGVIHSYTSGWQGETVISDPMVKGAREFLMEAVKVFDVQIYSSRSKYVAGIGAMMAYLKENDVHFDVIKRISFPTEKPPAFLTIDDRAYCFKGKFPDPKNLLKFLPWYKKEKPPTRGTCDVCHRDNVKLNPRSIRKKKCTYCFRHGYD